MLEVREETMERKEKAFIDCHSLLHYSLSFSPESTRTWCWLWKEKFPDSTSTGLNDV